MNVRVRVRMDYVDAVTNEPKHMDETVELNLTHGDSIEVVDEELMKIRIDVEPSSTRHEESHESQR